MATTGPLPDRPPVPPAGGATVASWAHVLAGVTIPALGLAAGVALAWRYGWFGVVDLALLVGMCAATMLGVTAGFHRLFTHRSFEAAWPVRLALGVLGSMAIQGPLLEWVGRHRLHHRFSDRDGDPHSPHAPRRAGLRGRIRAFWHAHVGWAIAAEPPDLGRYAPDLRRSRLVRVVSDLFLAWAVLGLAAPAAVGYALGGPPGAVTGFLWGGLVRVLAVHHLTWSVNSVCHLWGSRPYPSGDESRNNLVMGVLALGEGWHNNHHAFPTSARHGLRWWELDASYYLIRLLAAVGLAWDVKVPARGTRARAGA